MRLTDVVASVMGQMPAFCMQIWWLSMCNMMEWLQLDTNCRANACVSNTNFDVNKEYMQLDLVEVSS